MPSYHKQQGIPPSPPPSHLTSDTTWWSTMDTSDFSIGDHPLTFSLLWDYTHCPNILHKEGRRQRWKPLMPQVSREMTETCDTQRAHGENGSNVKYIRTQSESACGSYFQFMHSASTASLHILSIYLHLSLQQTNPYSTVLLLTSTNQPQSQP